MIVLPGRMKVLFNARKDFSHSFAKFPLQKNDNLLIWMQNFLYSETSSKILKIIYCQKIFFVIVRLENRAQKFVGRLHRFRDFLYNGRHLANFSVAFQLNMFLTSSLNGRNNSSSALRQTHDNIASNLIFRFFCFFWFDWLERLEISSHSSFSFFFSFYW